MNFLKSIPPLILRRYPLKRGRALLPRLIRFDHRDIPAGLIVRSRSGILVRMQADSMYEHLYLFGEYEPANTAVFQRLVRPDDTVFDVGANFGWYSGLLSRVTQRRGRVHAFEPLPSIFALAAETIKLNGLTSDVTLNNEGLGAEEGRFTVFTFKDLPHGHASASDLGREDAVPHECRITTLDRYATENALKRIDFMKVDVEGHELAVFEGGKCVLSASDAPIVCFEINVACLKHRGIRPQQVTEKLVEYGYTHFWEIDPFGGVRPATSAVADKNCDYLAAKPSRLEQIIEGLGLDSKIKRVA